MNLNQALEFSRLSTYWSRTDGCTLAPDLGVKKYCYMHDLLLLHLVSRDVPMNGMQYQFLYDHGFEPDYSITRKEADKLFKDGLREKAMSVTGARRIGYLFVEHIYYFFVMMRSSLNEINVW